MDINRNTMKNWVVDALKELGGSGRIIDICKNVWKKHGKEIEESGDIFFEWQYEIRWAGDILRKEGIIFPAKDQPRGEWKLTHR